MYFELVDAQLYSKNESLNSKFKVDNKNNAMRKTQQLLAELYIKYVEKIGKYLRKIVRFHQIELNPMIFDVKKLEHYWEA